MKTKVLFFVWAFLLSISALAQGPGALGPFVPRIDAVLPDHSGSWYVEDEPGWGVIINKVEEYQVAGWLFIYDLEGEPFWLELQGQTAGWTAYGDIYHHSGLRYTHLKEDQPRVTEKWGEWYMSFTGCDSADFDLYQNQPAWIEDGEVPGVNKRLIRLTYIDSLECAGFPEGISTGPVTWGVSFDGSLIDHGALLYPSGHFEYYDIGTECLWHGRITLDSPSVYAMEMEAISCSMEPPPFSGLGASYSSEEVCFENDPNQCTVYDEVLRFTATEGAEGYQQVIFLRNADWE